MAENTPQPTTPEECADAAALAEFITAERARLAEAFRAAPSGRAHSRALADLFDAVIRRLFAMAKQDAEADVAPTGVAIAILATGGYGRVELCPRSDIDVAFIAAEEEDPYLDAVVRRMFFLIMDVFTARADLKVGYAFRVLDDCGELDAQTRTALLDGRLIAGSESLVRRFQNELLRTMRPAAFLYAKLAEREAIRRKQGGAVHCTEPDIKECAGGLRDLHFAEWAARAQSRQPLKDPWAYLVAVGDIEPSARARAAEAHEFLLRLRHALHYACDRRVDALSRARQDEVAEVLGYADARALMADYFTHAEWIHGIAMRVGERLRRRMLPLTGTLVAENGAIDTADPHADWPDLASMVGLFRQSQVYGLPLCSDLGERVMGRVAGLPPEPAGGAAGKAFLDILRGDGGVETVLRQMARWGVLQRLVPEFGETLRLVPRAPVHEYTVGEHALRVVGFLEAARGAGGGEHSACVRVFAEVQGLDVLFLAALLHDLGKRTAGVHHAEVGAGEARAIALRLGMDDEAAERVAFLVRHHLVMSDTARLRDLTEMQTIRDFTAVVGSVEALNQLFLLTYADLRATGGGVWTPVQERFLEDLYYRAQHALSAPEPEEDLVVRVQRQRRRMQRELTLQNLPAEAVQAHCNAMPPSYLLNTPVETIAQHIRLVERLTEGPVVEFLDEPGRDFTTLTLCTFDDPRPGLLSKIAAALYAHSVEVHAAQVFTRDGEPGIALDTLWVDRDGRRLRSYERVEIERDLIGVLDGSIPVESLLRRRGKVPQPDLSGADVRVHHDVSEAHTVIEVRTPDRAGLLYGLTARLSELGWDIHSARINTIGGEARDAFYVTHEGEKLTEDAATIRARLLE